MASPAVNAELHADVGILLGGGEGGLAAAAHVLKLIQLLLGIWSSLNAENITLTRISAAMTNHVYRVNVANCSVDEYDEGFCGESEPEQLLLRVYGAHSEWLFHRSDELIAARKLSELGLIPRWLGIFGNGRVEEFILSEQARSSELRGEDLPDLGVPVIQQLGRVHASLEQILAAPGISWSRQDCLWERLETWRHRAEGAIGELEERHQMDGARLQMIAAIREWDVLSPRRLEQVRGLTLSVSPPSPLVFAHCDVRRLRVWWQWLISSARIASSWERFGAAGHGEVYNCRLRV